MPHTKPPDENAGQDEREPEEGHEHVEPRPKRSVARPAFRAAGNVKQWQIVHAAEGDDKSEEACNPFAVHWQGVGGKFPAAIGEDVDHLKAFKGEEADRGAQYKNPGKNR